MFFVGLTVVLPLMPVTVPTPLSIESVVALLVVQFNVALAPLLMVPGDAAKPVMVAGGTTVMVALAGVLPPELVAVRV